MNEPTKAEVPAEDWLKATSIELCKVADYFLALRRNTEEIVSSASKVNLESAIVEQENAKLRERIASLEKDGDELEKLLRFAIGDDEDDDWANHMMTFNKRRCRDAADAWRNGRKTKL